MICPNLSNPTVKKEFDELKSVVGEDMAYLIWNRNNGYHLDKASNGKPSKLFNDLLGLTDRKTALEIKAKTLSNAFKQWFGDSKVVDENGEPLVVYHGSRRANSIFPKEMIGGKMGLDNLRMGPGFYFSSQKHIATEYHDSNWFYENDPGEYPDNKFLHPSFLKIENDNQGKIEEDRIDMWMKGEYVVFEPNQIKSIFNSGVFNRYSDNIYDNDILVQEENRQQTSINGSMAEEIVLRFETYFPDYSHFNDDQRRVVAELVEQGKIQLSCTI